MITTPPSIQISSNISIQASTKGYVCIDIISPDEDLYREKNGVLLKKVIIIGHDSWQNKESMRDLAIELATAGFIAVCMDFRGLGESSSPVDIPTWINDISLVKNYLLQVRSDIDPHNFGYIGYGMGGHIGYAYIKTDLDFKTYVGMATGLSYLPGDVIPVNSRFLNLLIIQPKFDQTTYLIDIRSGMAARLKVGNPDIDVNKLYGCFDEGTASMIYLDDNSNHLTGVWDPDFIRVAKMWIINSFPQIRAVDSNFYANLRSLIFIVQLIGGLGFFFSIIPFLTGLLRFKKEEERKKISVHPLTFKGIPIRILTYTVVFSFPGIVLFSPIILFLPLAVAGFILVLFLGQVFGLSMLLWRIGKRNNSSYWNMLKQPFKDKIPHILSQILMGIFLCSILYVILCLSIGMNYLGLLPSVDKLIYLPIYAIIGFFIFLVYDIMFRLIIHSRFKINRKSLMKMALVSFGYQFFYYFTYILSFCVHLGRYYYFGTYIPIGIPIILLTSFLSAVLYQKTGNILSGVVLNTLLVVTFLCTISLPQNGFLFIWDYIRRVIANYLGITPVAL